MINRYFLILFLVGMCNSLCAMKPYESFVHKQARVAPVLAVQSKPTLNRDLVEVFIENPGVLVSSTVSQHVVFVHTNDSKVGTELRSAIESSTIYKNALRLSKGKGFVLNCDMTKKQLGLFMPYLSKAEKIIALNTIIDEIANDDLRTLFVQQRDELVAKELAIIRTYEYRKWKRFLKMVTVLRVVPLYDLAVLVGHQKKFFTDSITRKTK